MISVNFQLQDKVGLSTKSLKVIMDEIDTININFIVIQKKAYLVCLFTLCRLSSFCTA